jgi:hypothetical protein
MHTVKVKCHTGISPPSSGLKKKPCRMQSNPWSKFRLIQETGGNCNTTCQCPLAASDIRDNQYETRITSTGHEKGTWEHGADNL